MAKRTPRPPSSSGRGPYDEPTQRLWNVDSAVHATAGLAETPDAEEPDTAVTNISKISGDPASESACLVVIYGDELGRRYDLEGPRVVIGRGRRSQIQIDQDAVSRRHADICQDAAGYYIKDRGSTNGTLVNDQSVTEHRLSHGDLIKIGRCILKFIAMNNVESAYHEEIYRLTTVDGLTQIANRRFLTESLVREISRARRYRRPLSLAMFDIDHFKRMNDTYGHLAGDAVLKQLASAISRRIRREDTFARYGGEEFAVVLPEIELEKAIVFGDKLRRIAGEERYASIGGEPLTISVGVAEWGRADDDPEALIERADGALYEAKAAGRDRCVAAKG